MGAARSDADGAGATGSGQTKRELYRSLRTSAREAARGGGGGDAHAQAMAHLHALARAAVADDAQALYLLGQVWTQAARSGKLRLEDAHEAAAALARATGPGGRSSAVAGMLDVAAVLAEKGDSRGRYASVHDALDILDALRAEPEGTGAQSPLASVFAAALATPSAPSTHGLAPPSAAPEAFLASLVQLVGGSSDAIASAASCVLCACVSVSLSLSLSLSPICPTPPRLLS
jgi:hypothetical protein